MNDIPTNNSNPQEDNTSVNLDKIEKMIQNVLSAPSKENQAKINSILFHTNLNSLVSLFYEAVINKKFKGKEKRCKKCCTYKQYILMKGSE